LDNGTASASVSGATGAISYSWSNGGTTQTITDLAAGTYDVTVVDGNGCVANASATVAASNGISVTTSSTDESCDGNDGTATASVSGGSGAYTYAWSNGGNTATITDLTGGSYDVTVTSDEGCVATGSVTVNTETDCDPYCPSSGESTAYEWIDNVEVNGMDNQSGDNGGYADFTNITFQGSTGYNDITLTPGFAGNNYREYWRIWIDFNADGDFDDAGELVFQRNSKYAFSDYFSIPSSVGSVTTRMRVSMKYGGYAHPCEIFSEGEVEDYTIDITACDNVTYGGEIEADETLCPDDNDPTEMTSVSPASGGSGALEYVWLMSTTTSNPPPAAGWTEITGSNSPTYDPGAISQTTWYIRCARRAGCTEYLGESNVIEKTYNSSCGGGDYCDSYGESTDYEWIKKVRIQYGFNNNSGDNGGYGDYTNLSVDLYPGEYPWLQLKPGFSGSSYLEYWRVWVDWNNDGDFDDAGELENQTAGYGTRWTSIGVPYNAANGSYRMRVSMKYGGYADPCEVFSEGEVEDYTINVIGASHSVTNAINSLNETTSSARLEAIKEAINEEVNTVTELQVSVYPNPASDVLNVKYQTPTTTDAIITVFDVTGKTILIKTISEAATQEKVEQLIVSDLQKGAYYLRMESGESTETVKFFKL
jgi:hypothetical protein